MITRSLLVLHWQRNRWRLVLGLFNVMSLRVHFYRSWRSQTGGVFYYMLRYALVWMPLTVLPHWILSDFVTVTDIVFWQNSSVIFIALIHRIYSPISHQSKIIITRSVHRAFVISWQLILLIGPLTIPCCHHEPGLVMERILLHFFLTFLIMRWSITHARLWISIEILIAVHSWNFL